MVQRRWHPARSGLVQEFEGVRDEAGRCVLEEPRAALERRVSLTGCAARVALTAIIRRAMPLGSAVTLASPAAV